MCRMRKSYYSRQEYGIRKYYASLAERVWIMGMKYEDHEFMYDKNSTFFKPSLSSLSQAIGSPTLAGKSSIWLRQDIIEMG